MLSTCTRTYNGEFQILLSLNLDPLSPSYRVCDPQDPWRGKKIDEWTDKLISCDGITETHSAAKNEKHIQADEHKKPSTRKSVFQTNSWPRWKTTEIWVLLILISRT